MWDFGKNFVWDFWKKNKKMAKTEQVFDKTSVRQTSVRNIKIIQK